MRRPSRCLLFASALSSPQQLLLQSASSLDSAVVLLFRLVTLFLICQAKSLPRLLHPGVHVSASQLLSLPQWIGKRFVTVNKYLLHQYGTRSDGDKKTLPEVWSDDRYYIQAGVNADLGVEANPLLGMLMERHAVLRFAVCISCRCSSPSRRPAFGSTDTRRPGGLQCMLR